MVKPAHGGATRHAFYIIDTILLIATFVQYRRFLLVGVSLRLPHCCFPPIFYFSTTNVANSAPNRNSATFNYYTADEPPTEDDVSLLTDSGRLSPFTFLVHSMRQSDEKFTLDVHGVPNL